MHYRLRLELTPIQVTIIRQILAERIDSTDEKSFGESLRTIRAGFKDCSARPAEEPVLIVGSWSDGLVVTFIGTLEILRRQGDRRAPVLEGVIDQLVRRRHQAITEG